MESLEFLFSRFNYVVYVILMMIGLWAMIGKNNLVKKLIGMCIFQTSIILFYVSIGVKKDSTIPIITQPDKKEMKANMKEAKKLEKAKKESSEKESNDKEEEDKKEEKAKEYPVVVKQDEYANPLPHVLMLTAIVVGVATLGVALAIVEKIYRQHKTIEEDEILEALKEYDT